jgi:hypothetical protein
MASKKSSFMPKKSATGAGRAPRNLPLPKVSAARKSNQLPAKGGKRK